jgi:copper chaperone CopZ
MKTSTIEVHDMLSVFSVDEVEKRIGEVPGVESVTVNFAAGNAAVRYDETRLEATDIKSAVRQRAYESAPAAEASDAETLNGHAAADAPPAPAGAAPPAPAAAGATPPDEAAASAPPDPSAAEPPVASAAPEGDADEDEAATDKA